MTDLIENLVSASEKLSTISFWSVPASPHELILHVVFVPVSLMQVPTRGPMAADTELNLVAA